ncbi:aminotransferase class I/II-fold pyridoxal phosphate-dependent enzyme [Apilactobacillus xinyiensis]|uniref:aminotransferase class I/II-fold pyridoxal phosphate-dependent enzyme n=1 Tax=Apilactobacillus xinyiensis TaxID=2841032 RepID=UPI00200FA79E|nr:aminotransferase class I/II-fold pyridoxal phosphate-dependent enzyme [Apilactobacillus xinyiensis]MCL0329801.1 aminotransferase class I/II-fold pyridoxal phosphate-dependent enzyme [Apilactobacillus xinyiensis]
MTKLIDQINNNLKNAKENSILQFNKEISQIEDLIPLTLGEPDFNTPDHIKEAAIAAINNNESHYSNPRGIMPLRQAVSKFLADKYDLHYDAETQIITTAGVTEGIYDTLATILNPGDNVIIPSPTFPMYQDDVAINGANAVAVDTSADGFILTPDKLETTLTALDGKAKAVIINTPGNPTGVAYTAEQLEALAKVIEQHNLFCISDEIYSELTYDQKHVSIAKFIPENTILLNGMSKSHAMTGWRVGFILGPSDLIDRINVVHQFAVTCVTDNAQFAALEGLQNGPDDGLKMKEKYIVRRDILRDGLQAAGFESPQPGGAFYIFAKIPTQFNQDDFEFARELAFQAKVGVIPGSSFGKGGEGYIRLSYAASKENIEHVVERIKTFVANN